MELTDQLLRFKNEVREFVDKEIMPYAAQSDTDECMSPGIVNKLQEKGYIGSMLTKEYGGMGIDNVSIGILNEEIGRGCSSVRSLLTVHGMAALGILRWGTEEQQEKWLNKMAKGEVIGAFALTEPNVGSDAKSIECEAVLTGDNYIINGKKKWITMGQIADVFLLFARCGDKPTAFLVEKERPGFLRKPIKGLMGTRASMIAELTLEDCRIPVENLVGKTGTGLSHVALSCLDYGRYTVACGCVGIGQACLELSVEYVRKRKQFGRPLRENQLIQKMITEMVVNTKAARQLCYNAGHLKDMGDPDSIMETWIAKYFASTMLMKVVSDAVQIHGANGCCNGSGVERYYRDAKINEIIEGTSQMHEILIATNAFRGI